MQEAIPFRTFTPATATGGISRQLDGGIAALVTENSVIVFGKKGCCMCHVVKKLLLGLGVNPAVFEVDEAEEAAAIKELNVAGGGDVSFPAVFVGGKLFGGLERVMATHISGELVPILKDAGALWL